jgi:hypothetical protein
MYEKSHRKSTCNLHLTCEDGALRVSVELHLFYVGSNIQNASEKFVPLSKFLSQTPHFIQTHEKNQMGFGLEI